MNHAKILVVTGHYLPGYKAGGPIRTLANITEQLGDEFQFYVLTADRDLDDHQPYANMEYGKWCQVGKANVRYLSPWQRTVWSWCRLLRTIDYDVLYLNSCFAAAARRILLLRWCGLIPNRPVILAPRGEFSEGAVRLKMIKKQVYLWLTKFIRLYDGVLWQASSQYEKEDILRIFNGQLGDNLIMIAPNLPGRLSPMFDSKRRIVKQPRSARIIFLSRIARKKNLDFALDILSGVDDDVEFDIYGPTEDLNYWQECQALIECLPDNIKVTYKGVVHPEQASAVFSQYNLFLFPTRGENFGHVISEALRAGCPVLISDQTPWHGLEEKKAGWVVPLSQLEKFQTILNAMTEMDDAIFQEWSQGARVYGERVANDPAIVEANRQLFLSALN